MQIRTDQIPKILPTAGKSSPRRRKGSATSPLRPPALAENGLCAPAFGTLKPDEVHEFLVQSGIRRMHLRAKEILHDIIRSGMKHAFLVRLFDVCGFPRNRKAFGELLNRLLEKYPESLLDSEIETLIWGESGLLPSHTPGIDPETKEKARILWNRWWELRPDSAPPIAWIRQGERPLTTPERRIAGVCLILKRHGTNPLPRWIAQLKQSGAEAFRPVLLDGLVLNDNFWNSHSSFHAGRLKHAAALIGQERARELAADLVLPALHAAAELEHDTHALLLTDRLFRLLPRTRNNRVLLSALKRFFPDPDAVRKVLRDAASRQGVLHLSARCCRNSGGTCTRCPLPGLLSVPE